MVYRLHGHPAGQCVGDRVNDFLCLFFAAMLKDIRGEIEADMDRSSKNGHFYFTPFIRFPTPSHTIDDIGWLVLPVTRCIIAKNGQNATDTYMLCVTLCNVLCEIVKNGSADLFSNEIFAA